MVGTRMSRYWDDELYHFGIKHRSGRYKWGSGERPYQGDGGIRSTISRKIYNKVHGVGRGFDIEKEINKDLNGSIKERFKSAAEPTIKQGKGKADKSAFEVTADRLNGAIDSTSSTLKGIYNLKNNAKDAEIAIRASKMTNEELRAVVQRKNLEQQYVNAMHDPSVDRGFEIADTVLKTAGSAVTIGGGIAGIYSAFKHKN